MRRSTTRNHLLSEVVGVFAKLATKMRKFAKPSWRSFRSSENHFATSKFDKLTSQTSPSPSTDFRNTSLRAAVNLYPDSVLGASSLRDVSAWRISFARRSIIHLRAALEILLIYFPPLTLDQWEKINKLNFYWREVLEKSLLPFF